jgi:hypothetical protein
VKAVRLRSLTEIRSTFTSGQGRKRLKKVDGEWSPERVLEAFGLIGYDPVSALLDICDNSVSAGSSQIRIKIDMTSEIVRGGTRAQVEKFLVADNGSGMDENGVHNALSLGSSEATYTPGTLSKFGMGLKSASSSLGRCLTILTKKAGGAVLKAELDQEKFKGKYWYSIDSADQAEIDFFREQTQSSESGTVVVISKIRHGRLPRISEIKEQLKTKVGLVFGFYIEGKVPGHPKLDFLLEDESIGAIDPLFISEIDPSDSELDENTWDGCSVRWISRDQKIQLDTEGKIFATVDVTQLPQPPMVEYRTQVPKSKVRDKYLIEAKNYGFYVYRNNRLISWADSLQLITQDQKLYGFRGRVLINNSSDEILNIDVTKSRIHLSELAIDQLRPLLIEAKKKSSNAWEKQTEFLKNLQGQNPHDEINEQLDKLGKLNSEEDLLDERVAPEEEQRLLKSRRQQATRKTPTTEEESKKLTEEGSRVQYVSSLINNQLWERALDSRHGLIVRVNQSHRMIREIVLECQDSPQLIKTLDLLFFCLAQAEYHVVYKETHISQEHCEKVLESFREQVSSNLSETIRKIGSSTILNT